MADEDTKKWGGGGSGGGDNDDDEEIDETQYKHAKDAVLFAVEVSPSMLSVLPTSGEKKSSELDSPLSAALKCALSLMQQRIISHPNDMMGILLYGTEKTKFQDDDSSRNHLAYPNCYLLSDLQIPAAEDVKALRKLLQNEVDFKKIMQPATEKASMSNVLFCANHIFATRAANFASRVLFIITDEDDPHPSKDQRNAASVRAKDLYDLGVVIELFPIAKVDHDFDRSKFYNDIVYSYGPLHPNAPALLIPPAKTTAVNDGISLLNSLLSTINSRAIAKRAFFSNMSLEIGPGFKISVKGYIIFKRQEIHKSSYIWLGGDKPLTAKSVSSKLADGSGKPVERDDIRRAFKFGGDKIVFSPEELSNLRNFGDPVIRILGFKDYSADTLPAWANVGRSTFIYPSEEGYVGSSRVFSALHASLLKQSKMAFVWHIARKNASPVLAAMIAGKEAIDPEMGGQQVPAGLWLIPLPFADDIRDVPETRTIPASDDLVDKMRIIIQQLQLPKARYFPSKYPNPSLQWHYRILQAMALEEDLPEKPEDKTLPRTKQIHKRAGEYVVSWGEQLERDHENWARTNGETTTLPKHQRNKSQEGVDGPPTKRIKKEVGEHMTDEDMRKAWKEHRVQKMTLSELKAWATAKGISDKGKKADVVDAIESWFEQQ